MCCIIPSRKDLADLRPVHQVGRAQDGDVVLSALGRIEVKIPVLGAYYATTTKIETLENGLQKITTTKTRVTDTKVLEEALSVSDG